MSRYCIKCHTLMYMIDGLYFCENCDAEQFPITTKAYTDMKRVMYQESRTIKIRGRGGIPRPKYTDMDTFIKNMEQIKRKDSQILLGYIICGDCGYQPDSMVDWLKHALEHISGDK